MSGRKYEEIVEIVETYGKIRWERSIRKRWKRSIRKRWKRERKNEGKVETYEYLFLTFPERIF